MNLVIQLANEGMGRGDEVLGKRLMNTFLHVLTEASIQPNAIVLFNSGVKLACEGSAVLDELNELEQKGITILACGTCLNHFELSKKIKVGRESNMVEITEAMINADRIVPL